MLSAWRKRRYLSTSLMHLAIAIFPPPKRCCPYEGGVCCPNGMTCCPKGSTCQDDHWASTCIGAPKEETGGLPICKPGAPLPFSKTLHNVVIIGDSVSIGYTPKVTAHMASTALVQHSPYDVRDGGAEETAYGVECAFCSSLSRLFYCHVERFYVTTLLCLYYPEMHCFTALCAIYTPFLQFRFKISNSKVLITWSDLQQESSWCLTWSCLIGVCTTVHLKTLRKLGSTACRQCTYRPVIFLTLLFDGVVF